MTTALATAPIANMIAASLTLMQPVATVFSVVEHIDESAIRPRGSTTQPPFGLANDILSQLLSGTWAMSIVQIGARAETVDYNFDRPTTPLEQLIGELKRWQLMSENWDGEGAAAPLPSSLAQAVSFVHLLGTGSLPSPMLHASGHAGLFWKTAELYADLEFLGDNRIAYYIERHGDKHKGVVNFDKKQMPAVLATLLQA